MTWDKRLYFLSEGRRAEDFFALKNPTASVGFEPANLGTKSQHATSTPPKPQFTTLETNVSGLYESKATSSFVYCSQACPCGQNLLHSYDELLVDSSKKEESLRQQLFSALNYATFIGR